MDFRNKISLSEYNNNNYINDDLQTLIDKSQHKDELTNKAELYEKTLISHYLPENAKVLELGGGWGSVSKIIQQKINNKNNHIIIEPENERATKLIQKGYKVFNGIISNNVMWLEKKFVSRDIPTFNSQSIENIINIEKLEKMNNIKFDTIIADCEGALPKIFKENPQLFKQIKFIQIEYDWYRPECTKFRNKLLSNGFISKQKLPLHWSPSKGKGCFDENKKIIGHEVLIKPI